MRRDQRRQVPFAASIALNDVAFEVRKFVVNKLYPNAFPRAHNKRFPGVAFRVEKSTKRRLRSAVFDRLNRHFFDNHIRGVAKRPFSSSALAVPVGVQRLASGKISKARRPEAIKNSFVHDFGRGPAVWQRMRNKRLKLLYTLEQSTPVRRSFPFFKAGEQKAAQVWPRAFRRGIERALKTAR